MKLIQFFRLLIRNVYVLILVPLIIAITMLIFTKNTPNRYVSSSSIYTGLASGYAVENGEKTSSDFNAINTAFDNIINIIKSRETKEEVALRLLAHHLVLEGKANKMISQIHLNRLRELLPQSIIDQVLVKNSVEQTYRKLKEYKAQNEKNIIYKLIHQEDEPYYSVHAIDEISVSRVQTSDIIKLEFESDDPGICKQVIELISSVFITNFKLIKKGETSNVTDFFEKQTRIALENLNRAEERLKEFRTANKIINYDEQTKFISEKHEDIIDELTREKMNLIAAETAASSVDAKLGSAQKLLQLNTEIMALRSSLSKVNSEMILLESAQDNNSVQQLSKLSKRSAQLKQELDQKVNSLFTGSVSKEGISQKELANKWLEHALKADESRARLSIFGKRIAEIEGNYLIFAPLGSNISKMEREIGIAEKEYLSHLASLNASRLREQNLQMSTNLQIVDPAFFPIEPLPNKRKLILIAGTLSGFFIVLIMLVLIELLDQTIKTVERAHQFSGKAIVSGFPELSKKRKTAEQLASLEKLVHLSCSVLYEKMLQHESEESPFMCCISSSKSKEGKSMLAHKIADNLRQLQKKVLILKPEEAANSQKAEHILHYPIGLKFMECAVLEDLLPTQFELNSYDLILLEIPAFCEQKTPVSLLNECDLAVFVLKASRIWDEADRLSFGAFDKQFNQEIVVFLNGMQWHQLESFIGEVPRKRSFIRKQIKKWMRFDFGRVQSGFNA